MNEFTQIMDRAKVLLNASSDSYLAETLGFTRQAWNNRKHKQSIPYQEIVNLASKHNIDINWLITGEGSMYRDDASAAVNDDLVSIDHYPIEASAGFGCYPADHVLADNKRWFSQKWLTNKGLYSKDLSLIRVHGDSMVPMLQDKDLIMFDTSKTIPTAAMPFVVRVGDVLYVKLLALLSQKTLRLMSANKFYSDIEIDLSDPASGFAVIGAVVWHAHSYI